MLFKRKKETPAPVQKIEEVSYQADRRDSPRDRRHFGPPSEFPLVDSDQKMIQQDRRARPERRINNIVVTETRINLHTKL